MTTSDITVVEQAALTWPEKASELVIHDQETYDFAANTLKDIARLEKEITEHYGPLKKAAQESHKAIIAAEKKFLDPLIKAKTSIKGKLTDWTVEQNRIREEARIKAEKEAREKEETARLEQAAKAEAEGKPAEAEKIINAPVDIIPSYIRPTYEKNSGVSLRETWRAEVVDLRQLCEAIVAGKVSVDAVSPNMPYLNGLARADKDNLSIPGVKAVKDVSTTVRS